MFDKNEKRRRWEEMMGRALDMMKLQNPSSLPAYTTTLTPKKKSA